MFKKLNSKIEVKMEQIYHWKIKQKHNKNIINYINKQIPNLSKKIKALKRLIMI